MTPRSPPALSWFDSELLRAVLESTSDAVYVKTCDGKYVAMNPAGARMLGKTPKEILGCDDFALFDPQTARRISAIDQQVIGTRQTISYEDTPVGPGPKRRYATTKGPLLGEDGAVKGVFGVSRDVQPERLAAFEDLAAAIAHEIRSPLGTISNAVSLLRRNADGQSADLLAIMREETDRLERVVSDLLEFRPNLPARSPILLARLLDSSLALQGQPNANLELELFVTGGAHKEK